MVITVIKWLSLAYVAVAIYNREFDMAAAFAMIAVWCELRQWRMGK